VQVEYDDIVPVLPAKNMTHSKSFLDRLQRVEKHLRKNKLKLTLMQRLGNAQDEDEVQLVPCSPAGDSDGKCSPKSSSNQCLACSERISHAKDLLSFRMQIQSPYSRDIRHTLAL
jgi:hypothetical protein